MACCGSVTPGSSTTMRSAPCCCTNGSVTPSPLTRFSTMSLATVIAVASTVDARRHVGLQQHLEPAAQIKPLPRPKVTIDRD